jgi:hypothetical protein
MATESRQLRQRVADLTATNSVLVASIPNLSQRYKCGLARTRDALCCTPPQDHIIKTGCSCGAAACARHRSHRLGGRRELSLPICKSAVVEHEARAPASLLRPAAPGPRAGRRWRRTMRCAPRCGGCTARSRTCLRRTPRRGRSEGSPGAPGAARRPAHATINHTQHLQRVRPGRRTRG